jgi:cell division protein ZapA
VKQLEVQIMGQSYLLGCPEGGESKLLDAVERVDTAMCKIRDAGKVKARDRIAVLAALNLAFDVSEREAASLAAASFANSELQSVFGESLMTASTPNESNDSRLVSLVQRLDTALGDDGRLL